MQKIGLNDSNTDNIQINMYGNKQISKLPIDDYENECPICLNIFDYFGKEESLILFPIDNSDCKCNQIFHLQCILDWLKKDNNNKCPICLQHVYITNSNNLISSSRRQLNESIVNIQNYYPQILDTRLESDLETKLETDLETKLETDLETGLDVVIRQPNNIIPSNTEHICHTDLCKNILQIIVSCTSYIIFIIFFCLIYYLIENTQ